MSAAREALEAAVEEAKSWAQDVSEEIGSYIDERSEKWREGDRGQAYDTWKDAFGEFDPDLDDMEAPDPAEAPDTSFVEEFSNLPDAPDV